MSNSTPYCSELSLAGGEPLHGSAPHRDLWLLLEYDAPWGPKAFEQGALPSAARAHIRRYLEKTPGANVLFIRQPGARRPGIRFFLARTEERAPAVYGFTLDDYAALAQIDFAAIAAGAVPERRVAGPLFLVCAHGKRDRCCARAGMPVWQALRAEFGERAWVCSHLGGHRFAPTALFLPQGICYGRLPLERAVEIARDWARGEVHARWMRGRCAWPPHVQAAAILLRQRHGLRRIDDLRLEEHREDGAGRSDGIFRVNGSQLRVRLARTRGEQAFPTSCVGNKTSVAEGWQLLAEEMLPA